MPADYASWPVLVSTVEKIDLISIMHLCKTYFSKIMKFNTFDKYFARMSKIQIIKLNMIHIFVFKEIFLGIFISSDFFIQILKIQSAIFSELGHPVIY